MTRRQRWTWLLSVLALAAGFTLMFAAFGVSASRSHQAPAKSQAPANSQAFGDFRAVLDTIDFLDPAYAYTGQAWWAMWAVWETLVTYRHVPGAGGYKLVPGLAASMPKISRGGTVYSFKLRPGLKYSDGRSVKASDFKFTIERDYRAQSPGVGFYEAIVGAKAYEKSLKGHISGIIVNNSKRTITIKLTSPRGDFLTIIALLFAAPVPAGTPDADQSTKTIPSTGPYRITSYDPTRGFTMVRNKFFRSTADIPKGNPSRVDVSLIGDANAAVQRVIGGQADYTNAAIPPDRIKSVSGRGQLRLRDAANTYYFWMNTRVFPFNKVKVRQAVNYAIDRNAMQKLVWGGLGKATQNVLPPTYPSYTKLNLYPHNVKKAQQMIKAAGVKGVNVTVWARQVSDSVTAAQYYTSVLNRIGFNAKLNLLPRATYYVTIGNANTKAQTGWARWLEDYPHPLDWFDVLLNGERITSQLNNNFAWYSNSKTNKEIDALKKAPVLTPAVNTKWAAVEKQIMDLAPWAPWSNRVFPEFFSNKMGCISMQRLYGVDFLKLCKK
ncbi:MAG: ABC transporter substrate-binding protein [Gaiellaceae bacterium]